MVLYTILLEIWDRSGAGKTLWAVWIGFEREIYAANWKWRFWTAREAVGNRFSTLNWNFRLPKQRASADSLIKASLRAKKSFKTLHSTKKLTKKHKKLNSALLFTPLKNSIKITKRPNSTSQKSPNPRLPPPNC